MLRILLGDGSLFNEAEALSFNTVPSPVVTTGAPNHQKNAYRWCTYNLIAFTEREIATRLLETPYAADPWGSTAGKAKAAGRPSCVADDSASNYFLDLMGKSLKMGQHCSCWVLNG